MWRARRGPRRPRRDPMDALLERLKHERRWAIALFVAVVGLVSLVQLVLTPAESRVDERQAVSSGPSGERP